MTPPPPTHGWHSDTVNVTTSDGRTGKGWYDHHRKTWFTNLKRPFEITSWTSPSRNVSAFVIGLVAAAIVGVIFLIESL